MAEDTHRRPRARSKPFDPDDPNPQEEEDATGMGEMTRRDAIKTLVGAGVVGATVALGASSMIMMFQPKVEAKGVIDEGFVFKTSEADRPGLWYADLGGKEVVGADFKNDWDAAATFWRLLRDEEGAAIEGTGVPALVIRVNPSEMKSEWEDFYSFLGNNRYMAVMMKCTHACCVPNFKNSRIDLNTIYCVCHDSQYDMRTIVPYQHDRPPFGKYWGVLKIPGLGPAPRGMPVIPIVMDGDRLVGKIYDISWYIYCGVTPPTT